MFQLHDKDGIHIIRSAVVKNPMLQANLMIVLLCRAYETLALRLRDSLGCKVCCANTNSLTYLLTHSKFYRTGVMANRSFTLWDFNSFCSCALDLDPMTFIHDLGPYSLEIYCMCIYGLPTSRLLKVVIWQTDWQTDRQTDRTDIIYHTTLRVVNDNNSLLIWAKLTLAANELLQKETYHRHH